MINNELELIFDSVHFCPNLTLASFFAFQNEQIHPVAFS